MTRINDWKCNTIVFIVVSRKVLLSIIEFIFGRGWTYELVTKGQQHAEVGATKVEVLQIVPLLHNNLCFHAYIYLRVKLPEYHFKFLVL